MKFVLSSVTLIIFLAFSVAAQNGARKYDSYGDLNREAVNQRLESLIATLNSEPKAVAFIVVYGGRNTHRNDLIRTASWARAYLISRNIADNRITLVDGGYREEPQTDLWIGDPNGPQPVPEPNVDPSEVVPKAQTKLVDVFEVFPAAFQNLRLDWLAAELKDGGNTAKVYFVAYGSKAMKVAAVAKQAVEAKNYLMVSKGVKAQQIVIAQSKQIAPTEIIEVWLVPPGQPAPNLGGKAAKPPAKSKKKKS